MTQSVTMTKSSSQRRRYLAARRRGLSQSEAMREVKVSRSSAWRYDQLFNQEETARAAIRDRVNRAKDDDEALREAADKDVELAGPSTLPMPPWESRVSPSAQEPLVEDESYPAGLLQRRMRAQAAGARELPRNHPANRSGAVTLARGEINDRLPNEQPSRNLPV